MKRATETTLKETVRVKIRFSEVDSMAVVWHGNYIHFFEDAREAFGEKYGLNYLQVYSNGFFTPLVSIHCDYKTSLKYGDEALIEITYYDTPAAKIIFKYKIYNAATGILAATGETTQVFLSTETNELSLNNPPFFDEWKQKMGLK